MTPALGRWGKAHAAALKLEVEEATLALEAPGMQKPTLLHRSLSYSVITNS